MRFIVITYVLLLIISSGCGFSQTSQQHKEDDYNHLKAKFDSSLLSHFPTKINNEDGQQSFMIAYTAMERHDIGILLYEYKMDLHYLDSIENYFMKYKTTAKYYSYNDSLLIVNKFETKYSFENNIKYPKVNSLLRKKSCTKNMLPVPKFIDYDGKPSTRCGLDSTFTIYVIEAKSGIYFERYQNKPFEQMPKEWKNGYSKGIAISRKDKTVIYWSIMW